jgi:pyruvate,water dikinase
MLKAGNRAVIRRNLGSKLLQMEFTGDEKAGGKRRSNTDDADRALLAAIR